MAGLMGYKAAPVLRAADYKRAREFYTEKLGLEEMAPQMPVPGGYGMFKAGDGTVVTIYERPGMPAPQNTTLAFAVPPEEFDSAIADLKSRGVTLEDYDIPEIGLKTTDGVAEMDGSKSAWFLDSEGNILNVVAM